MNNLKYFDIENYEIKVEKLQNSIKLMIRDKLPPFSIIYKEIILDNIKINLIYQIIMNCFYKKENYDIIIIKCYQKFKNIHFLLNLNSFINVVYELYNNNSSYSKRNINENITIYTLYEKPIEEFDDKIYLFSYKKEYKFNFNDLLNYYENKDCKSLEIKYNYDYNNRTDNPPIDDDGWEVYEDEKFRYYMLYYDKYFYVQNISKLYQLEKLSFEYYKYENLEVFSNNTLIELTIGSYNEFSDIKTMKGISNFNFLSKITFIKCFLLNNIINVLEEEENCIKELNFYYCDKINIFELVNYCTEKKIKLEVKYYLS